MTDAHDHIGENYGPYFGRVFSGLELDVKTRSSIPAHLTKGEAELYAVKHAAYRKLHPMAATMEFSQAYIDAYRWIMRKREDFRLVKTLKVFGAKNPMEDTEQNRVGLWTARRSADRMGMPYDRFCMLALDYSERADWDRLALPRELSYPNVLEYVASRAASG